MVDFQAFDPLPKQEIFLYDLFDNPDCKFLWYCGGFGSGKTYIGSHAAARMAMYAPGGRGLIARQTAVDLKATTMKTFFEVVDPRLIYSHNRSEQLVRFINGHEVYYWGLDDIERLKSLEIGWFWIDEVNEVALETFNVLKGRLRHKAQPFRKGFITSNSEGKNWTYKQFVLGQGLARATDHEKYYTIKAPSDENTNLPDDYLDVLNSYTGDLYQRYVKASFDVFEGQIYPELSTGAYFIPDFAIPAEWIRIRGIDHGERNPTACLWCAVSPAGDLYFYREYYEAGKFVSHNAKEIAKMSEGEKIDRTLIDPSVKSARGASGKKLDKEYKEEFGKYEPGFKLIFANNDVTAGIARVHRYLAIDPMRLHPVTKIPGAPRVFFFNSLTHTRDELEGYRWKKISSTSENDPEEKPRKRDDHCPDVVRYVIMSRPDIQLGYVHGSTHGLVDRINPDQRGQLLSKDNAYLENLQKQFPNSFRPLT